MFYVIQKIGIFENYFLICIYFCSITIYAKKISKISIRIQIINKEYVIYYSKCCTVNALLLLNLTSSARKKI